MIDMAFAKKRVDDRKLWLLALEPGEWGKNRNHLEGNKTVPIFSFYCFLCLTLPSLFLYLSIPLSLSLSLSLVCSIFLILFLSHLSSSYLVSFLTPSCFLLYPYPFLLHFYLLWLIGVHIDYDVDSITYDDFINRELILFSHAGYLRLHPCHLLAPIFFYHLISFR